MDRLNQFLFKDQFSSKLSTWMKNSDFEKIITWIEDCFDTWNEPIKALGEAFLEEQDSYFLDLQAQYFEMPSLKKNEEEQAVYLEILYHSLKQPATLTTLYQIGLIYFTPLSLLIIENGPGIIQIFGELKEPQSHIQPQDFIKILECIAAGIEYHIQQIQSPCLIQLALDDPINILPNHQISLKTGILSDENGSTFILID